LSFESSRRRAFFVEKKSTHMASPDSSTRINIYINNDDVKPRYRELKSEYVGQLRRYLSAAQGGAHHEQALDSLAATRARLTALEERAQRCGAALEKKYLRLAAHRFISYLWGKLSKR
jgi:hypothetical protein